MVAIPTISIIVPIYNASPYLPQCIDSILVQTFKDFELLLVDDGSTDNSFEIATEYSQKDTRIKVLRQENGGVTSARKLGVQQSTGSYIYFVDADDTIPVDALDILNNHINNMDMIIGTYHTQECKKTTFRIPSTILKKGNVINGVDYIRYQLENKLFHSPWAKLIKRECLSDDIFDIPRTIFRGEDFLMNIKLGTVVTNIKVVDIPVYNYIIRKSSCMHSQKPSLEYEKLFDSHLIDILTKNKILDKLQKELTHQRAEALAGLILANCKLKAEDPFIKYIRETISFSSFDFTQILIKLLYNIPFLFRLSYRLGYKIGLH